MDDATQKLVDGASLIATLDALEPRSVVMDGAGEVWRKLGNGQWDCLDAAGDAPAEDASVVVWQSSPPALRVLWTPALEAAQRPPVSAAVLDEYRRVAEWLDGKAAILSPVGDTMHGLAAEALHTLIEGGSARSVSGDDPIPRYAQLDVWMALFGAERSEEYEPFREEHGFAETWSWLLAQVRRPPVSPEVREEMEAVVQAEDERWDGSKSSEDFSTRVTDALLARFSVPSQPVYDEEKIARWLMREFGMSNGTQAWMEFQGSASSLAAALVAAMPTLTREETNE